MNLKNSIAWSFTSKPRITDLNSYRCNTPGPGNYKDDSPIKKNVSYTFRKSPKNKNERPTTPGPGYYVKTNESLFGKTAPKFTMAKTIRKEINLDNSVNVGPKMITPGPGQYSVDLSTFEKSLKKKNPAYKIPKSSKEPKIEIKSPGPGAYNLLTKNNTLRKNPGWK
jgi:hypothetical protein